MYACYTKYGVVPKNILYIVEYFNSDIFAHWPFIEGDKFSSEYETLSLWL